MTTRISVGEFTLTASHYERNQLDKSVNRNGIVLISVVDFGGEPDVLTELKVDGPGVRAEVVVHWTSNSVAMPFHAMVIPETNMLFVGAGTLSAAVNLITREVVDEKKVFLFWGFERRCGFVLELGELECYLYNGLGRCIGSVPVDPPYDIREVPGGLEFVSPVMGSHVLRFPGPDETTPPNYSRS